MDKKAGLGVGLLIIAIVISLTIFKFFDTKVLTPRLKVVK